MKRRRPLGAALLVLCATADLHAEDTPEPTPSPPTRIRPVYPPSGAPVLAPLPQSMPLAAAALGGRSSVYESDEVVTVQADADDARRIEALMRLSGGRLLRRRTLPALGLIVSTYRMAFGAELPERVRQLTVTVPELLADLNHRYYLQGTDARDQAFFRQRVGWSAALAECARDRSVGLIDTAVADHPALRRARIRRFVALPAGVPPAPADHGTAIASLLVGDPAVARFGGLIPQAVLYAAEVFRATERGAETSAESLTVALDWLVAQRVAVINFSVGGPENRVLARAVEETLARGIVIVAAAGNSGADTPPEYPAAWAPVISVTAVDADLAAYGMARHGDDIDFAAPGVDVWAAAASGGGRFWSGTSFAAPFVTAAVAALGRDAEARLAATARDLGRPGRDPVFGHGLIQPPQSVCGSPAD